MTEEKAKMENITDNNFKKLFVTGLLKRCTLFSPTNKIGKVLLFFLVASCFIYLMNIHSDFVPQINEIIGKDIV